LDNEINKLEVDGYLKLPKMSYDDLEWLRDCVRHNWRTRIISCYPEMADIVKKIEIQEYHKIRFKMDHEFLWGKKNRLFSLNQVEEIQKKDFFFKLQERFGLFEISEKTYDGGRIKNSQEVYWRIVSPGYPSDVGGVHADYWFHKIHDLNSESDSNILKTLKVWIPVFCEPQKNGLLVAKGSHKKIWKFESVMSKGIPYPIFSGNSSDLKLELVDTEPGEALIFGDSFIHAGAVNNGLETRVSIELTLTFKGN
jgi:hypothetical protein